MKLRYTPEAISDLQEIKRYIAKELHNQSAANRITKIILDQCASLERFPKAGAELSAMTGCESDLRILVCEGYIALYRIDADAVSVARVIHSKQDYMRILFRENNLDEIMRQQNQSR